jgi:hypothetical protein
VEEQPTFVEFAAPSPVGTFSPEETYDHETEQAAPPEVPVPEEVPAPEETAQGEAGEPQEMANSAPEEAAPMGEEAISSNQVNQPARSTPRKAGLLRRLARFVSGM